MSERPGQGEWEKTDQAPETSEAAGVPNQSISTPLQTTTGETPTTGGRVDAAAATLGSGQGLAGGVAVGLPPSNVGGAMATTPGAGVADQPADAAEGGPQDRAGVLGSPDATAGASTSGGTMRGDLGGAVDSTAEAAAKTARQGDDQSPGGQG